MSHLLDSIIKGLALAKAKGCPVEGVWVNPNTDFDLIQHNNGFGVYEIERHHISVVNMAEPFLIKLACGWTDRTGHERTDINALDVCMEHSHLPAIDTAPMEHLPQWGAFS